MADTPIETIREEIKEFLEGADLSAASSKKVRAHLNTKFDCDFSERKKEIDKVVMDVLTELEDAEKKDSASEPEDQDDDNDDDYSEEDKPKKKRAPPPKKPIKKKRAKSDSDDEDDASDDDGSDEDYKGSAKKSAKKARSSNGSAKKKAAGGAAKGGGGAKKATGYLKKLQLSPDLAEVMGEDQMARNEVVKKMYVIVKDRDLLDPKNRQFAILDDQLQKVFGQKRIRMFGMMKLLGKHFSAAE